MKYFSNLLKFTAVGAAIFTSCADEPQVYDYNTQEQIALGEWIEANHPELVNNYQETGSFYVEWIEDGDLTADPIKDSEIWIKVDLKERDLAGNLVMSREEADAYQQGTFSKFTHYVPYLKYSGDTGTDYMEGIQLSLRNDIKIGDQTKQMRIGSKVRLYLPSSIVLSNNSGGGYEGDYTLAGGRPLVVDLMIRDTISNPLEREGTDIDKFATDNGGVKITYVDPETEEETRSTDPTSPDHPYNDPAHDWFNVADSIPHLYVNPTADPGKISYIYPDAYTAKYNNAYSDMDVLNAKIRDIITERFGEYEGIQAITTDSIGADGTVNTWYITRLMDGFIVDTNIPELRTLLFDEVSPAEDAFSVTISEGSVVSAWLYALQNLRYGQWASILTSSTYAYGATGVSGSSDSYTTGYDSSYYDYMNYYNYANSYYGNSYYGGYYGGYYDSYYGGYYGDYSYSYDTSTTETTTSITTEIPPYAPLIFDVYLEPQTE